jgi:hypothetical protein
MIPLRLGALSSEPRLCEHADDSGALTKPEIQATKRFILRIPITRPRQTPNVERRTVSAMRSLFIIGCTALLQSMPAQTESTNLLSPFSDLRVRYGIKLSLASLLSLYVALDCRREFPTVRGALEGLRHRAEQIRRERILASESLDAPIQLLDVISRCQRIGDTLEECASLIKSLSIYRYWGDYVL